MFDVEKVLQELCEIRKSISQLPNCQDFHQLKEIIMATQADLDAAIAALPQEIETALEIALAPVIAAIQAKAPAIDFSTEVASLNAIPAAVASAVTTAVTPAS